MTFRLSFGAYLRAHRESQRKTIEDLSAETRISEAFLRALEADDLNDLPDYSILRGYVRSIARTLEMDQREAVAQFEFFMTKTGRIQREPEAKAESRPRRGPKSPGVVLGVVLIAFVVFLLLRGSDNAKIPPIHPISTPTIAADAIIGSHSVRLIAKAPVRLKIEIDDSIPRRLQMEQGEDRLFLYKERMNLVVSNDCFIDLYENGKSVDFAPCSGTYKPFQFHAPENTE